MKLNLAEARRVILDMSGSDYATILVGGFVILVNLIVLFWWLGNRS